jgi:hypothetical protein
MVWMTHLVSGDAGPALVPDAVAIIDADAGDTSDTDDDGISLASGGSSVTGGTERGGLYYFRGPYGRSVGGGGLGCSCSPKGHGHC